MLATRQYATRSRPSKTGVPTATPAMRWLWDGRPAERITKASYACVVMRPPPGTPPTTTERVKTARGASAIGAALGEIAADGVGVTTGGSAGIPAVTIASATSAPATAAASA